MKLIIIIMISVVMLIPSTVLAETQYKSTSVSTSVNLDPVNIRANYELGFDIIVPTVIEAGDTVSITIIPSSSTVTSTVKLSGSTLGTFTEYLVYGQESIMGIPGGYGLGAFVTSTAYVLPSISGPAHIVSNEWLSLKDTRSKTFQISINNDIGRHNSITLEFETLLDTHMGINLDLILFDEKLISDSFRLEPTYQMPIKIPLKKVHPTNLVLEVKDGTCTGCIQVKPILTYGNNQKLHSTNIAIYVDGSSSESGLTSNQWSWNFSPSVGNHVIEAKFFGKKDSTNSAISYSASQDSENFLVNKKTSSSSTSTSTSSSTNNLRCGSGTNEKNGECVANDLFGGGCLIATATYGSEMATQVQQLRELRDNQLLNTESGSAFMSTFNDVYYSFSPIIADYERENPYFKEAVKLAITPMISSLSLMENAETESEVLSIGISVIMLNLGMYLGVPAIVIVGIRKRF